MPNAELSLEDLAELGRTFNKVLEHPETRDIGLRVMKKATGISVPEIDLKDQANAAFRARDEKIASLENGIRERDARERVERERRALEGKGFSADDVAAIEKLMIDEQIPNYGTAANHYKMSRQLAAPTPATGAQPGSTYDLPSEALAAGKSGRQGLNKFARQQADAAMAEITSGRIKLH